MQTLISRRKTWHGLAAMLFVGSTVITSSTRPALAHEAPCPYCTMTITPDTTTQDNETVLKAGRKRIEYKCVFCALAEAKTEYKGDVTIIAPSEKTKVSRNVWPKERKRRCLSRLTRSLPTSSPSPMR